MNNPLTKRIPLNNHNKISYKINSNYNNKNSKINKDLQVVQKENRILEVKDNNNEKNINIKNLKF